MRRYLTKYRNTKKPRAVCPFCKTPNVFGTTQGCRHVVKIVPRMKSLGKVDMFQWMFHISRKEYDNLRRRPKMNDEGDIKKFDSEEAAKKAGYTRPVHDSMIGHFMSIAPEERVPEWERLRELQEKKERRRK